MDKIRNVDALILTDEKDINIYSIKNLISFDNLLISTNNYPLEGIYRGLLTSKSNFVFVISYDTPNINKEIIDFMLQFLSSDYDAIILRDSQGKVYPLFGIYNKSSFNTIESFIIDKNYKIQEVLFELKVKYVSLKNTIFDFNK